MSGYMPFGEFLGHVMAKASDKSDRIYPAKEFVSGLKRMGDVWGVETKENEILRLNKPAMVQLVKDRLGGIPALLNDRSISERTIQSYLMDKVLGGQEDKPLTMRITKGQIDGVLSEEYAFYDNTRLMILLAKFIKDGYLPEVLVHTQYISPGARDLHARFISPENWNFRNGEEYYGSLAFSNNELGLGSLKVAPALARVSCFNYVIAENSVNVTHRFSHQADLDRTIEEGIRHIQEYSRLMFERTQHSHDVTFDHPEAVFHQVGRALNLSNSVEQKAEEYWLAEGQSNSLFGIVQAITYGTQAMTTKVSKGRRVEDWGGRDDLENRIWMWSEDILNKHQQGSDINEMFSSAELIQKSKVLEVLQTKEEWRSASELVKVIEPQSWIN